MLFSPLEQFEIYPLRPIRFNSFDLSITNSTVMMFRVFCVLTLSSLVLAHPSTSRIVPSRWQTVVEALYSIVQTRVQPLGSKGQPYFPFIFVLFRFILVSNLLGLVPYSFTVTSHLIVTLALTRRVWVGKLLIGVRLHGIHLLGRFLPAGAPLVRAPRLVPMEIRSFFITLISLSVRLFANRMAGHILLKVIAGFAWTRMLAGGLLWVAHFIPLLVLFMLLWLETGVAMVQAYVFSLLTAMYIGDMLAGGH